MTRANEVNCPKCGWSLHADQALMSWLCGRSPNPLSCPSCGELIPSLRKGTYNNDKSAGRDIHASDVADSEISASTTG
jgi:uncharacterized Zn finger protein